MDLFSNLSSSDEGQDSAFANLPENAFDDFDFTSPIDLGFPQVGNYQSQPQQASAPQPVPQLLPFHIPFAPTPVVPQTVSLAEYTALQQVCNQQAVRIGELERDVVTLRSQQPKKKTRKATNTIEQQAAVTLVAAAYDQQLNDEFAQVLQQALGDEDVEMVDNAEEVSAPFVKPTGVPSKPWILVNATTRGLNRRPGNIANFDPAEFYQPLETPPASWGSIDSDTQEHLFRYTAEGELLPGIKLTADQMLEYLTHHPLHERNEHTNEINGKKSGLALRIQITPADSLRRYPHRQSDKCRFVDCPVKENSILKGQYRVCLDELSSSNESLNPFHNAGYVHLFCMEKFLNFPQICATVDVVPENRALAEGKNRMAISRDSRSMLEIVLQFQREAVPWAEQEKPRNWYKSSLCLALSIEHLRLESNTRREVRLQRGGNHIGTHMNNLDIYAYNIEMELMDKKNARLAEKREERKRRREQEEESDEEDEATAHPGKRTKR